MFYSQLLLSRKGPLGKIWLAAHNDKKLTKTHIFTTDISDSVESILNPKDPLALRMSGHLMLGIVRIFGKKVKYLLTDATEAMWKIKHSNPPGEEQIIAGEEKEIDDDRYFGKNIYNDTEFPGLEDEAFSQEMLKKYANLQAARRKTIVKPHG